jgi:hypothetical protein
VGVHIDRTKLSEAFHVKQVGNASCHQLFANLRPFPLHSPPDEIVIRK